MFIIRPIEMRDEKDLNLLFTSFPTTGILSLPNDLQELKKVIQDSLQAFSSSDPFPNKLNYFFVLENLKTKTIEGCCGIHASAGEPEELFYYKIEKIFFKNHSLLCLPIEQEILIAEQLPTEDTSELCSLFLSPHCPEAGMGRLLSLSRPLFIASHRARFGSNLMAEIRGVIDSTGKSPFWEALGRNFCNIDFESAYSLILNGKLRTIDILPAYPIYRNLLPKACRDVLLQPHVYSAPALKMLQNEGFVPLKGVDIFDGGIKVYAATENVKTIKNAKHVTIKALTTTNSNHSPRKSHYLANVQLDFRCCYGEVTLIDPETATIDVDVAKALRVDVGDKICFTEAKASKDKP